MTNKQKVLHLAAKVDQIYAELEPIWKDPVLGFSAGHQTGVLLGAVRHLSRSLIKLSEYVGMDIEASV